MDLWSGHPKFPLSGQNVYTIGIDPTGSIGSDFAVPVPKGITEAVYASDGLRYPLAILTPQLWSRIGMQDIGTIPQGIYFDRGYPVANIYIHGQPAGGELELYVWHVIPGVVSLSDVVVIPPGYEDALVLNLAVRLAPHFQKEVHPDVRQQARESLMRLESINAPQPIASLDNWGSCGCGDAYGGVAVVSGGGGSNGSGGGGTGPPGPPGLLVLLVRRVLQEPPEVRRGRKAPPGRQERQDRRVLPVPQVPLGRRESRESRGRPLQFRTRAWPSPQRSS